MRLGEAGSAALAAGCASPEVVARYGAKVVQVAGSDCQWWAGAVSGRGHGRFWLVPGRVVVAHRFAFALVHGVSALAATEVLGRRCDNLAGRLRFASLPSPATIAAFDFGAAAGADPVRKAYGTELESTVDGTADNPEVLVLPTANCEVGLPDVRAAQRQTRLWPRALTPR